MTTSTNELIDWLNVESKLASDDGSPIAASRLRDSAQRLRELESQVTELELKLLTERGAKAWKDVPDATAFVEELRGNKTDCVWINYTPSKGALMRSKSACGGDWPIDYGAYGFCPNCGESVKEK